MLHVKKPGNAEWEVLTLVSTSTGKRQDLVRRFAGCHFYFGAGPLEFLISNWAWCIGIVYSTLATLQHVAVDVLAGLALGVVAAYLSLRYRVDSGAAVVPRGSLT